VATGLPGRRFAHDGARVHRRPRWRSQFSRRGIRPRTLRSARDRDTVAAPVRYPLPPWSGPGARTQRSWSTRRL